MEQIAHSFGQGLEHDLGFFPSLVEEALPSPSNNTPPNLSNNAQIAFRNPKLSPLLFEERYRWSHPHNTQFGHVLDASGFVFSDSPPPPLAQISQSLHYFHRLYPHVQVPAALLTQMLGEDLLQHRAEQNFSNFGNNLLQSCRVNGRKLYLHPSGPLMDSVNWSTLSENGHLVPNFRAKCESTVSCIDVSSEISSRLLCVVVHSSSKLSVFDYDHDKRDGDVLDIVCMASSRIFNAQLDPFTSSHLGLCESSGKFALWDFAHRKEAFHSVLCDESTVWSRCRFKPLSTGVLCALRDSIIAVDVRCNQHALNVSLASQVLQLQIHPSRANVFAVSTRKNVQLFDERYCKVPLLAWKQPDTEFPVQELLFHDEKRNENLFGWNSHSRKVHDFRYSFKEKYECSSPPLCLDTFESEGPFRVQLQGISIDQHTMLTLSERGTVFSRDFQGNSKMSPLLLEDGYINPSVQSMPEMSKPQDLSQLYANISRIETIRFDPNHESIAVVLGQLEQEILEYLRKPRSFFELQEFVRSHSESLFENLSFVSSLSKWSGAHNVSIIKTISREIPLKDSFKQNVNVCSCKVSVAKPCSVFGCLFMHLFTCISPDTISQMVLAGRTKSSVKQEKPVDISLDMDSLMSHVRENLVEQQEEKQEREPLSGDAIVTELALEWSSMEQQPLEEESVEKPSLISNAVFSDKRYYY